MRCECCDAELNDVDATARFAESGNFVNMCGECRGWLPKDIRIVTRPDLAKNREPEPDLHDPFDLGDDVGAEWDDL